MYVGRDTPVKKQLRLQLGKANKPLLPAQCFCTGLARTALLLQAAGAFSRENNTLVAHSLSRRAFVFFSFEF